MTDNGEKERDDAGTDEVPAKHPTDDTDEKEKKDQDAAVDETSEPSMDASDPPAW